MDERRDNLSRYKPGPIEPGDLEGGVHRFESEKPKARLEGLQDLDIESFVAVGGGDKIVREVLKFENPFAPENYFIFLKNSPDIEGQKIFYQLIDTEYAKSVVRDFYEAINDARASLIRDVRGKHPEMSDEEVDALAGSRLERTSAPTITEHFLARSIQDELPGGVFRFNKIDKSLGRYQRVVAGGTFENKFKDERLNEWIGFHKEVETIISDKAKMDDVQGRSQYEQDVELIHRRLTKKFADQLIRLAKDVYDLPENDKLPAGRVAVPIEALMHNKEVLGPNGLEPEVLLRTEKGIPIELGESPTVETSLPRIGDPTIAESEGRPAYEIIRPFRSQYEAVVGEMDIEVLHTIRHQLNEMYDRYYKPQRTPDEQMDHKARKLLERHDRILQDALEEDFYKAVAEYATLYGTAFREDAHFSFLSEKQQRLQALETVWWEEDKAILESERAALEDMREKKQRAKGDLELLGEFKDAPADSSIRARIEKERKILNKKIEHLDKMIQPIETSLRIGDIPTENYMTEIRFEMDKLILAENGYIRRWTRELASEILANTFRQATPQRGRAWGEVSRVLRDFAVGKQKRHAVEETIVRHLAKTLNTTPTDALQSRSFAIITDCLNLLTGLYKRSQADEGDLDIWAKAA